MFRQFRWRAQGLPAEEERAEFQADEHSARKREEAANLAALKKLRVKKCPNCGQGLQKIGGCDYVTCVDCRIGFKWSWAKWAGV